MQEIADKILEISFKAERMDRFVRLLLQEQAKMEDEIEKLQAENAQLLLENKQLKEKKYDIDLEIETRLQVIKNEYEQLKTEHEELKTKQQENVALRASEIEAQDAMKIKLDTYIKEIDACLKIFGE